MADDKKRPIIIKKKKKVAGGHHGGAWKVAYADFVTAMMAFFMVMWLVATMPQEQLGGVADYFKNPSAVEGRAATMAPGSMGPGGAGNAPIKMFEHNKTAAGKTTEKGSGQPTAEEARKILEEQDKRNLEELKQLLEEAIANSQALAPFKDQLLIDITPEGLRIQIVDSQNRPMFDLGSNTLKDYSRTILVELASYLNQVKNRVAISGHTDITPYVGRSGYSNWELSADRANSARRALVQGGLAEDKMARVVGLSSSVLFDKADPRNPINRRISIVVLNEAAERAARETDTPEPELPETDSPAPGTDADAAQVEPTASEPAPSDAAPTEPATTGGN